MIRAEKQQLIFDNRTAQRIAELILSQNRPRLSGGIKKEVVRIQVLVAEKFKKAAMKLIPAAFGDHVHIRARIVAKRRVIQSRLHLEFFNRIRIRNRHSAARSAGGLVVVH